MLGMSKKRIFIIFIVAICMWICGGIIQLYKSVQDGFIGLLSASSSCNLTGYPFAFCLRNDERILLYMMWLLNIMVFFVVLNFLYYIIQKFRKA